MKLLLIVVQKSDDVISVPTRASVSAVFKPAMATKNNNNNNDD